MNIYKITYYSYDEDCYCEEFSKVGESLLSEEEMYKLMDEWNNKLNEYNIKGRVTFSTISLSNLNEYSIHDLIRNISEL
jgi:hypothetical protein